MMILVSPLTRAQDLTNCPTVENEEQIFCSTTAATVSNLQGVAGTDGLVWYDVPQGGTALAPTEKLVDGRTYYAGNIAGTCLTRESVLVQIDPQPVAGRTSSAYFCANDEPIDLVSYMAPLTDGRAAQPGGTFSPTLASGTTIFDPSVDPAGRYTYTVTSPYGVCEADDARIIVFIAPAPNAGEDRSVELGSLDEPVDLFSYIGGTPDTGGTWSPALTSGSGFFDPAVDPEGIYTYTIKKTTRIGNSTYGYRTLTCTDVATVEVVVQEDSRSICHKGETIIVNVNAVDAHLKHGDSVGPCGVANGFEVNVTVSPNPSSGLFRFSSENNLVSNIVIKNMQGELVRNFVFEKNFEDPQLNLTDLKPGIYFAEVHTSMGIAVKRIVRN